MVRAKSRRTRSFWTTYASSEASETSSFCLSAGALTFHQIPGAPPSGSFSHWISEEEDANAAGGAWCTWGQGGSLPPGPKSTCYYL